jgi:NAD(P)-dependent dehydrogenase (short-subunit alcohol dehydrogenase family)
MAKNGRPAALVTGAARGIGRGIAARLLAEGWDVALADVLVKEGREAVRELNGGVLGKGGGRPSFAKATEGRADFLAEKGRGRALFVKCDVSEEEEVAAAVKRVMGEFGRLDALVNNAGLASPYNGPVEKLALRDWNRWIGVNLTGAFLCAKHAVPHLRKARGGGAIVNIASTRALQSEAETEAYSTSKAGMLGLTRALAVSLGPKVRVNAICPGWIDNRPAAVLLSSRTAMAKREKHGQHPVGRVGRAEDIAEMVLFLVDGKKSGFVTGQGFVCDGGMTVKMVYEGE